MPSNQTVQQLPFQQDPEYCPLKAEWFSVHGVRRIGGTSGIQSACPCPTSDVIAVVSSLGEVYLLNLEWARVWTLAVEENAAQVVCWRPDGKVLAVGYADGTVGLYDVETGGEPLASFCVFGSVQSKAQQPQRRISSISWTRKDGKDHKDVIGEEFQFSSKAIYTQLPSLSSLPNQNANYNPSRSQSLFESSSSSTDRQDVLEETQALNVLVVGDDHGCFYMNVFGVFDLGAIPVLSDSEKLHVHNPQILKATLSPELSLSTIIVKSTPPLSRSSSSSLSQQSILSPSSNIAESIHLVTLNTGLLHSRSPQILQLALKSTSIVSLTEYIKSALKLLDSDYDKLKDEQRTQFSALRESLIKFGYDSTLFFQLYNLLATGYAHPALQHWLCQNLGDAGIKKWIREATVSYANLRRTISTYLLPSTERLLMHLSDLIGLSRMPDEYSDIQLDEAVIGQAIKLTGALVFRLSSLVAVLETESKSFTGFLKWLESTIEHLGLDDGSPMPVIDVMPIVEYLEKIAPTTDEAQTSTQIRDPLALYLHRQSNSAVDLSPIYKSSSLRFFSGCGSFMTGNDAVSVHSLFELIEEKCQLIFKTPAKFVGSTVGTHQLENVRIATFKPTTPQSQLDDDEALQHESRFILSLRTVVTDSEDGYQLVSWYADENNGVEPSLWFVRYPFASSAHSSFPINYEVTCLRLPTGTRILDTTFYNDEFIMCLLECDLPEEIVDEEQDAEQEPQKEYYLAEMVYDNLTWFEYPSDGFKLFEDDIMVAFLRTRSPSTSTSTSTSTTDTTSVLRIPSHIPEFTAQRVRQINDIQPRSVDVDARGLITLVSVDKTKVMIIDAKENEFDVGDYGGEGAMEEEDEAVDHSEQQGWAEGEDQDMENE